MSKVRKDVLHLDFSIMKVRGDEFTTNEVDEFLDKFIELVESKNYSAGGGGGYYVENQLEITNNLHGEDFVGVDIK